VRPLDPDRWLALSPHLDEALELTGRAREIWLSSLRARDPLLAEELVELLAEHAALDNAAFLAHPQRQVVPSLLTASTGSRTGVPAAQAEPAETSSLIGQTVGAYTLMSCLGHGGMGTVWLARRSDGRFQGLAAVKLLNASLVNRVGEERFAREGTILARLAHPSIAHLIDAGVSHGGQPYLILEYVQGEHIDLYCDSRSLGVETRIRLFLDVLAAVAHAHANLVVHRDLKPSNVLVRTDVSNTGPSGPRVKLLDFGIAKLVEPDTAVGAEAMLSRHSGWAMTPAFAAPEQLTGGAVTTATDVYALGVLLYVLLGGRHPAGGALRSPADLISVVVDAEPPRLSEVITRTPTEHEEGAAETAARRGTTPDRLQRVLKGDLETIVGTALKKEPRERYPSITAFADDLQRYLDQRPIRARPDSRTYRAAKFVHRNRVAVALVLLAVLALLAGLVGTITQARRAASQAALAHQQRQRADAQRDFAMRQLSRAEAINDLNAFLLSDAAPAGKPFTVGDLLAQAERLVSRPEGESVQNRVDMLVTIGRQYEMQDEHGKARRVLEQAYDLSRQLPDAPTRAKAGCAYALILALGDDTDKAEVLFKSALAELPDEPQFALDRIGCYMRGSSIAQERGDMTVGLERAETAERLRRESPLSSALLRLNVTMRMAESNRLAGRYQEASAGFEDSFVQLTALGREGTERAGTLLNNWGMAFYQMGQPLEAERLFRRVILISSADGTEQSVSSMLINNLARTLRDLHKLETARDYAERAYAKAQETGNQVVVTQSLSVRASIYRALGDFTRAARALAEYEAQITRRVPAGHIAYGRLANEQALLAAARGELPAAIEASDRALAIARARDLRDYQAEFLMSRAAIELQRHQAGQARTHAAAALTFERAAVAPGRVSAVLGHGYLTLGRALVAEGRLAEAQPALASAVEHLTATLGADHPDTRLAAQLASGAP
jgi:eukaryotic-like serine/threonine-protein kinase